MNTNKVLPKVRPLALAVKDAFVFVFQLKDNANLVVSQVQIYSQIHNTICFKYGRNKT